jgi:ribosomal protein L11
VLSAIGTWLASQGASLLLGYAAQVILSALTAWQANKNTSELGRITAERDQAIAAAKAKDAELQAQSNAPKDIAGALARLDKGDA